MCQMEGEAVQRPPSKRKVKFVLDQKSDVVVKNIGQQGDGPLLDILERFIDEELLENNGDAHQRIMRIDLTPNDKVRQLLKEIPSLGGAADEAFRVFLRALRETQRDQVATELENYMSGAQEPNPEPLQAADEAAQKLVERLRTHHRSNADQLPVEYAPIEAGGSLDDLYMPLIALEFSEDQQVFARQGQVKLSRKEVRELASQMWVARRKNVGEEIERVSDLLRLSSNSNELAKKTLLLSHAAAGKTWTLLKLAALWASGGDEVLAQFEFVFFVSARDEKALFGKSAIDVLQLEQYDLYDEEKAHVERYLESNSDKVLILLDGADQGGKRWSESEGLKKILSSKGKLHRCAFLITSRCCEAAFQLVPICKRHFHLAGMSDSNMDKRLRRRLGDEKGMQLSKQLREPRWSQLRVLMKETPSMTSMVADTLVASNQALVVTTRTTIYTNMVLSMAESDSGDDSLENVNNFDELPGKMKASLIQVGQMALKGLKDGEYIFDFNRFKPVFEGAPVWRGLVAWFQTAAVVSGRRRKAHQVQFCHLTYQEFLAAYCVAQSDRLEDELKHCEQTFGTGEETALFWQFLAGFLGVEKIGVLVSFLRGLQPAEVNTVEEMSRQVFLTSCFAEAIQQHREDANSAESDVTVAVAQEVLLGNELDLSSQVLSVSDMHAVAISLERARHITYVDLNASHLDRERLEVLRNHHGLKHVETLVANGNPLHGDGLATLAEALCESTSLDDMLLSSCELDDDDCATLRVILKTNKSLRHLKMDGDRFTAKGLKVLMSGVRASQLQTLQLSGGCCADADGATEIGQVLADNSSLKTILLHSNALGSDGMAAVLNGAATARSLEELDLCQCVDGTDENTMAALSSLVNKRSGQTDEALKPLMVRLHRNKIGEADLEKLAETMPQNSTVSVLCDAQIVSQGKVKARDWSKSLTEHTENLRDQGIQGESLRQVALCLENDQCPVHVLDLGQNALGDEGAIRLARALDKNSRLRGVLLHMAGIGGAGFAALTDALVAPASRTVLQWLELYGNAISNHEDGQTTNVREDLRRLVAECRALRYLGLSKTGLGDPECAAIAEGLSANSGSILFLALSRNELTDKGVKDVCEALQKNTTVKYLDLSLNKNMTEAGAAALAECVRSRLTAEHRLVSVWVAGSNVGTEHLCGGINRDSHYRYQDVAAEMNKFKFVPSTGGRTDLA